MKKSLAALVLAPVIALSACGGTSHHHHVVVPQPVHTTVHQHVTVHQHITTAPSKKPSIVKKLGSKLKRRK